MRRLIFALAWLLVAVTPGWAQNTTGLVVTTCGTVVTAFKAGNPGPFTVDVNGNLCQTGGGGGGGSVTQGTSPWVDNITQWGSVTLGAATAWGTAPTGNVPGVNANILGPLGQQLSAASIPVVLPAAQITTLTPPTTITANQGTANATPWNESVIQWAGGVLGAMANYGTSPGTVLVPGVNAFNTNLPTVAVNTAPVTATNPAVVVDLRPDSPGIVSLGQTTKSASVPVTLASDQGAIGPLSSQYPGTASAVEVSTTGTTAATAATMPAVSGKTNYVCGFTITADATALATGTAVLSGLTNSLSYLQTIAAVANGAGDLTKNFNPCIPASATNTAIVITSAAAGVGGNTIVNIQGYVQ
jgi:hypothetical protein